MLFRSESEPAGDGAASPGAGSSGDNLTSSTADADASSIGTAGSATASNTTGKNKNLGIYSLEQFGPITTPEQAQAAFEKAGADISAAGGGFLVIPVYTPAAWQTTTMPQPMLRLPEPPAPVKKWGTYPGVTVIDQRKPGTYFPTQVTGWIFDRKLKAPVGWSPEPGKTTAMFTLNQRILSGTSDVSVRALESVQAGSGRKVQIGRAHV